MGKPAGGNKHVCASCETRYYDMGATNALCPSCGVEAANEPQLKPGRGRKPEETEALVKNTHGRQNLSLRTKISEIEKGDEEDNGELIEDASELDDTS